MEKEKHTLHFSLGANAGIMLQNIAYEHLFCEMEPQKAWDALVLSGCPEQYVAPILRSQLFLTVIDGGTMGICSKGELPEGDYEEYHKFDPHFLYNTVHKDGFDLVKQGEYLQKNMYQFFSNGLLYVLDIEHAEAIFDMPKNWHWEVRTKFTPMDIAKIWMNNDFQMQQIIESGDLAKCFGDRISNIFNDLEGIREYVNEGMKLVKLRLWLMEHLGCSGECEGFTHYEEIVADLSHLLSVLQELDEEGVKLWNEQHSYLEEKKNTSKPNYAVDRAIVDKFAGRTAISKLDDFLEAQAKLKERDLTKPVTWDHNWTAGFIDREGHIYAMDGHESRLAHLEIADAWYEKYPNTPLKDNNRDWSLDRLGWIRFHEGRLRYTGYSLIDTGWGMRDLPFTSRQKDRLAEYCEKFYPYGIYNEDNGDSHTMITADNWRDWNDDQFRKIFEF